MSVKEILLTDDILFKETFGRKQNIFFLEHFLEDFFQVPYGTYHNKVTVQIEHTLKKTKYQEKNARGDIFIYLENKIIILEMYNGFDQEAFHKSLTYCTRTHGTQVKVKEKYVGAKEVICINIIQKVSYPLQPVWFQKYRLSEQNFILTNKIQMYFLNLDEVKKIPYNVGENHLLTFLRYLGANSIKERMRYAERDEFLMSIETFLKDFMMDKETNEIFSLENKIKLTGRIEGREEGQKIGQKIGRIRGKKERNIEIGKRLLKQNYPIEEIINITGLTRKEIERFKNKVRKS